MNIVVFDAMIATEPVGMQRKSIYSGSELFSINTSFANLQLVLDAIAIDFHSFRPFFLRFPGSFVKNVYSCPSIDIYILRPTLCIYFICLTIVWMWACVSVLCCHTSTLIYYYFLVSLLFYILCVGIMVYGWSDHRGTRTKRKRERER